MSYANVGNLRIKTEDDQQLWSVWRCGPTLDLRLVPHTRPRRRAGWSAKLNVAVDSALVQFGANRPVVSCHPAPRGYSAAKDLFHPQSKRFLAAAQNDKLWYYFGRLVLASERVRPPDGVSWADWDRVLATRRVETSVPVEDLRYLGPKLEAEKVLLTVDEVLTRRPDPGRFLALRTARIANAAGYRYLSGVGAAFLQRLHVAVLLCLGLLSSLLLIADDAR